MGIFKNEYLDHPISVALAIVVYAITGVLTFIELDGISMFEENLVTIIFGLIVFVIEWHLVTVLVLVGLSFVIAAYWLSLFWHEIAEDLSSGIIAHRIVFVIVSVSTGIFMYMHVDPIEKQDYLMWIIYWHGAILFGCLIINMLLPGIIGEIKKLIR